MTPQGRARSGSGGASLLVPPQSSAMLDRVEAHGAALPRGHVRASEPMPESGGLWVRLVRVYTRGAEARASVGPDGRYSVFVGATGTS